MKKLVAVLAIAVVAMAYYLRPTHKPTAVKPAVASGQETVRATGNLRVEIE